MADILGIGEVLWDVFPHGKILGGAPANFVYHCRQLGHDAQIVSRIGTDELGERLLAELKARQIPTSLLQRDCDHPTGTVQITMSGIQHTFRIIENVAWDFLAADQALIELSARAEAVCFGSLAQRCQVSRKTISELIRRCPKRVVCDINLRQQFYSRAIIEQSLRASTVLKLNDDELKVLDQLLDLNAGDWQSICRALLAGYGLNLVCVTRAERGAAMVTNDVTVEHPGVQAKVVDTVGCGDAFCAVLVDGLLRHKPLPTICEHANRVGAFVASQPGATPPWPEDLQRLVRA